MTWKKAHYIFKNRRFSNHAIPLAVAVLQFLRCLHPCTINKPKQMMTPGWPQMTLEVLIKNLLWMVTTPTKFQVHMTLYTNMTSDDPRMTSNDPRSISKIIPSEWWVHPQSFKSIWPFILIWPLMTPGWPKMTQKYPDKTLLWIVTTLTKFQVHTTLNTNMTSDDTKMTSDDPRGTSKKILSEWWIHPPSFKSTQPFILIWPQMTPGWPQMTWKYQ